MAQGPAKQRFLGASCLAGTKLTAQQMGRKPSWGEFRGEGKRVREREGRSTEQSG